MSINRGNLIWIEPPLACGGMAEVWRVINQGAEGVRNIAVVKRILLNYASNAEFTKMFIDEARITSQLHRPIAHPNIIQILEFQQLEDEYLLFLEYVNGPDVRCILTTCGKRGIKIPITHTLYIISELLNGLYHAHSLKDLKGSPRNIIHRDISPQNVLVSYSGDVKICDWGIADAKMKSTETVVGVIKGKYGYMSPEQANAEKLDCRTDVYSAAVVLWEMLTGKRLFVHENDLKTLKRIQKAEIESPRKYNKLVSKNLVAIVLKALAKRKEKRFADGMEFVQALLEERNRIDPAFSRAQVAHYLQNLFEEDIKKDQVIIAQAEKQLPSDVPPTGTFLKKRKKAKPGQHVFNNQEKQRQERPDSNPSGPVRANLKEPSALDRDIERRIDLGAIQNSGIELDIDDTGDPAIDPYSPSSYQATQKDAKEKLSEEKMKFVQTQFKAVPLLLMIILLVMMGGIFLIKKKPDIFINSEKLVGFIRLRPASDRALLIETRINNLTIKIAGKTYFKKDSKPFLIRDIPAQTNYFLEITRPGFEPVTDTIQIKDNTKLTYKIQKMLAMGVKGSVLVETSPRGAAIYFNGKNTGKVTPNALNLNLGEEVEISLRRHGYEDEIFRAKIEKEDELLKKKFVLRRTGGKGLNGKVSAVLKIDSSPTGAYVNVNSDFVCKTPCLYKDGSINDVLNVDIMAKGYRKYFTSFPLKQGNNYLKTTLVKLKYGYGYLSITSIPEGEVYIDGRKVGDKTPLMKFRISTGKHRVRVVHRSDDGEKTSARSISVNAGQNFILNLVLD